LLARHEFLIRRLHSLTGLVPVGAFMAVHLSVNASVVDGPATFQRAVFQIHSLGNLLPLVEWAFIFGPILFHGLLGLWILRGGMVNTGTYRYANNVRYFLQRISGIVAFAFIIWHVFHMHGWFPFEFWRNHVAAPFGGGQFRPYNAASTLAEAMAGVSVPVLYALGVLACVFHFANGLWTMGITWGLWTSPNGQRRATGVCALAGLVLAVVGLTALGGALTVDVPRARAIEDAMYVSRVAAHEVSPNEHKRLGQVSDTDAPAP
jgi:succinate dehydrogenase / fumarate reductase cytochrome b subunit